MSSGAKLFWVMVTMLAICPSSWSSDTAISSAFLAFHHDPHLGTCLGSTRPKSGAYQSRAWDKLVFAVGHRLLLRWQGVFYSQQFHWLLHDSEPHTLPKQRAAVAAEPDA